MWPGWRRSNTPFVKTIVWPAARARSTRRRALASVTVGPEFDVRRKTPAVTRAIDADVLRARIHTKRVEEPVVVVRIPIALVDGDVELVGAIHEIEALDGERRLGLAGQPCRRQVLEVRV